MRILHYALGFPPYRTGGLTKFCMDLMKEQLLDNDTVALIWPGERLFSNTTKVVRKGLINGIESIEVKNPNPVPYDEGITEIEQFIRCGDFDCYDAFIKSWKPDVIHIHTFMGLHKSFLAAAKINRVKLVFTAHDFFPLCPKVTVFRDGKICESIQDCKDCPQCNLTALSITQINILQSGLYRNLKDLEFVKKLRKKHRDSYLSGSSAENVEKADGEADNTAQDYLKLRSHYISMLDYMDVVHYNSTITKNLYEKIMGERESVLIPITHSDIKDCRKVKKYDSSLLRVTYMGAYSAGKGFMLLKEAMDELWEENKNISLNVFFQPPEMSEYIKVHGRYDYSQLESIFDKTDVLVAPGLMYDTFGYTVLEALSFGVPVVISSNIGAKDIVNNGEGIVIEDISKEKLKKVIGELDNIRLSEMNKSITESQSFKDVHNMCGNIKKYCYLQ